MAFTKHLESVRPLRVALTKAMCPITRQAVEQMRFEQLINSIHRSEKYRYIYINNPKTGCSTLKTALIELELRDTGGVIDLSDRRFIHGRLCPLRQHPPIWPSPTLSRLVQQDYTFISFIRNPYTRLASCYFDKIASGVLVAPSIFRALPGHRQPESFTEFVHQIVSQMDSEMNPHWRPQVTNLLFGQIPYTFIGRFETYAEDFVRAFAAINVVGEDVPILRHLNKGRYPGVEPSELYDAELQTLVYQRYQADFEAFGYAYDLPA